ncbi:MAG: EscU/YscU/HrcU family type III secretion system export apparatus switch protein, partial [Pseudomonadota bacterium]
GLIDFAKDAAKMLFAGAIGFVFLVVFVREYYGASALQMAYFFEFTFGQVFALISMFAIFYVVLAAIDLPIQRQLHANKMRMSREELKKEVKQSEGDPQLKQQRREKAAKLSKREMFDNVKTATVIMTNPEHYAVALRWDPDSQRAPVCVAKGVDHTAARIREIAIENQIPIYRDPPAARSMYALVDIDEEIHPEHFAAVAAAIQFVDRVRGDS